MASADDRRRRIGDKTLRMHQPGGDPLIERQPRKEPSAGDLRAGNRAGGREIVELALLDAEIGGGFLGGEIEIILHEYADYCIFSVLANCAAKSIIPAYKKNAGSLMEIGNAFAAALRLMLDLDPGFLGIVGLSLRVTLSAILVAAMIGLPLGALLALARFPGRTVIVVIVNALMGLPPVVAGLIIFLLLSRSGPLGGLGWLFTPRAMILAQAVLILPIIVALTRQVIEDLWREYAEHFASLGLNGFRAIPSLLVEARFSLATALLAGFGRASAEVGAVLIVGGNIAGHTRSMTTAIALETSKGDLPLAVGLGIVLLLLTLSINALAYGASRIGARYAG